MAIGTLVTSMLTMVLVGPVWAQTVPSPPTAPPAGGGDAGSAVTIIVIVAALLLALGVTVKLFDLRHKREAEAVRLQAQVSDALLRDADLFQIPLTPTARVPFWSGSPATIEVAGQVPTAAKREAVLRIVRSEAARVRPDVQIEDRMAVVPTVRAA
jgi:hypothetical protein